ncbi:MAG: hypothetical protein R2807_02825 [Chitinophagales bacterium]
MHLIYKSFFIALISISTAIFANNDNTVYTAQNLTPEIQKIIAEVNSECKLNADQAGQFKNDYILFLNENAKPNANTNVLLFLLGTKMKGYVSNEQLTKITQMAQNGKLVPSKNTTVKPTTNTSNATGAGIGANSFQTQSNVTALFEQLQSHMKVSNEKAAKVIPILKNYDAQLIQIKTQNKDNTTKQKQLTDALNNQTVPQLKAHLNDQQIATLVLALSLQENILSGKNLSADQKQFLDKIRNQYKLNDVQTMSVVLVLVQGKIRGDLIALLHKTDPQKAGQEFIILMQDLDAQLKTNLSGAQYQSIKSDIEKLIKGQKL